MLGLGGCGSEASRPVALQRRSSLLPAKVAALRAKLLAKFKQQSSVSLACSAEMKVCCSAEDLSEIGDQGFAPEHLFSRDDDKRLVLEEVLHLQPRWQF